MVELSIIIPCRNDAAVLGETLAVLHDVVTRNSLIVETLVVDDESTDGTLDVAGDLVARYPPLRIRLLARKRLRHGFGAVVRYGLAYARGPYVALVAADGTDPLELLPRFLARLRDGAQLAQCTRYANAADATHVPRRYRTYQTVYRWAVRLLLGRDIRDTTYGFRAFDRVFVQAVGLSANRFNVCPEMTFKALLAGGRIDYVPGRPRPYRHGVPEKFKLPWEIGGYAYVVMRAALHRFGVLTWL